MEEAGAGRYLTELNQRLRKGWTAHLSPEGRIYYMSHETRMSSWLPPVESWDSGENRLPYAWEEAVDELGKTYYINHASKTCVRERPRREEPGPRPQPRSVVLTRDPQVGFGFVAGSERPVIVRFVTEGGPNEGSLLPGDQILQIDGEDVQRAPREKVIELIRSCKQTVTLLVCQPQTSNGARKSALLTAAKKEKLKNNPPRVRFSEGVVINGSPLYSPSPMDSSVPFLPNVLKVFLENGQTKSFKYDSTTTVQDVLNSMFEKLSLRCTEHFSLATEHVKIARKNRLTVLDPTHTLAKIAARPGSHHLRCVFRVSFVPRDAYDLLQKDQAAFEYLYLQCCNDVVQERFAPELKYDVALRLAALHIHQHCLSSSPSAKVTVKAVERECGLEPFVPVSLRESMKRKELRKVLGHCLKQAAQGLCAPGQRRPTPLQAKLHYLKVVAELPSYGSKCFSTNMKDSNPEIALLVSPRFGISQIACLRSTHPVVLARIEELSEAKVSKEDEISSAVELFMKDPDKQGLEFSMEDRDVDEFLLMLRGYFRLLAGKELPLQRECGEAPATADTVPCFPGRHTVLESPWSYPPGPMRGARCLDLTLPPPPYVPAQHEVRHLREKNAPSPTRSVDFNMNENPPRPLSPPLGRRLSIPRTTIDERHPGIDYQSVISMELLEDSAGDVDVDVYEAKNEEVIRRITEMSRILDDVESYMDDSLLLENEKNQKLQQSFDEPPADDPQQIEEEVSPSESDTDSTPNDSPLHRNLHQRNSINNHHRPIIRRDSSFGLHSPDLLPDLSSGNNILDILKHLQAEEVPLPFAEETLYLDPDIIDLTMIPPPVTPESGPDIQPGSTPLRDPPTPFLDVETLQEEIDRWIVCPGQPGISVTCENGASGEPEHSLESFIASLTVPPPPTPSSEQPLYVIPPPPSSSPSTEVQEQVIARFVALSQDMKRLFEGDDRPGRQSGPESPVPDDVVERRLRCPEGGAPDGSAPSDEFELCFQTLELDSGSHSGDSSSGYETLFGDPFSADDFSPSPSDPVPPRLRTSCVDDPAGLSLTSPSSTTSSDSSVILLDPEAPESRLSSAGPTSPASPELLSPAQTGLVRSASWTHVIDGQKPPVAPNPFQQNRLRRSFHRGSVRVPPEAKNAPCPARPDEVPPPAIESRGPFDQAQRDLSAMISHLRKLSDPARARPPGGVDATQCRAATEALVNESRRFVTSSKLFVKSALDASGGTVQNMAVCVALLNRMTALGELVLLRSPEPAALVLDRLREVSEAFLRTVAATDTPHLLQRATALATGLTALMRTLRAVAASPTTA